MQNAIDFVVVAFFCCCCFLFQFSLTMPYVELSSVLIHVVDLGVNCVGACCVSLVAFPFHLVGVSDPTRLRREKGEETEILPGVVCR